MAKGLVRRVRNAAPLHGCGRGRMGMLDSKRLQHRPVGSMITRPYPPDLMSLVCAIAGTR